MSHLHPSYGGPRDWQDGRFGWAPPDGGDEIRVRARHTGAVPDAYSRPSGPDPAHRYGDAHPGWHASGPGPAHPHSGWQPEADRPRHGRDGGRPPERRRYRGRRRAGRRRAPGGSARGRAGRNLPAAIVVGLALIVGVLLPLFLLPSVFFAVIAVAAGIGIWEMVRAVRSHGVSPPLVPLLAGAVLMIGLAWRSGPDGLSLGLLVTALAVLVWRLADGPSGYQRDVTAGVLIAVYVAFLAGFAALLVLPSDGALRVLATLAAVVLSDTGGYVVGVFFGRHPMAPSVSPKKSWEGFLGSIGSAAVGSAVLLNVVLDTDLWSGALFGLGVSVAAVLGDLCESMIKRDLGIKDMSQLLPGHGGLMDRLDSILFAVPTAYLLFSIILPTS